jgi:hypothetical protein
MWGKVLDGNRVTTIQRHWKHRYNIGDFSLLALFLLPWRWRWHIPPKRQFIINPHGVTSKKRAFFIVTHVKTSNPTKSKSERLLVINLQVSKQKAYTNFEHFPIWVMLPIILRYILLQPLYWRIGASFASIRTVAWGSCADDPSRGPGMHKKIPLPTYALQRSRQQNHLNPLAKLCLVSTWIDCSMHSLGHNFHSPIPLLVYLRQHSPPHLPLPFCCCFLNRKLHNNKQINKLLGLSPLSTFANTGCLVVRAMYPHGHIINFLDQSHYFFQAAPRDLWVCSQELWQRRSMEKAIYTQKFTKKILKVGGSITYKTLATSPTSTWC